MPYRKLLHDLYQCIPDNLNDYLFSESITRYFGKEDIISHQGTYLKEFFRVKSGIVRAMYTNGSAVITTEFYFPGEMITCFIPAYTGEQMLQSLQAITETTLQCSHLDTFKERVMKNEEARTFFDKVIAVFMLEQQHRSQIFRTSTAIERYEHLMRNYPEYLETIPLKYLASFIDMKRETLSRMRKKLKCGKGIRIQQFPLDYA
jgi:CRP-like cAMP-binding protein